LLVNYIGHGNEMLLSGSKGFVEIGTSVLKQLIEREGGART